MGVVRINYNKMKYNFKTKQFSEIEILSKKLSIAGSDKDIAWETLKLKTEQLASVFKEIGIPKGHPIIIYGHKEYLFPLAILACIHSNTTYIPIDKIYPIEWGGLLNLKYMLTSKGIKLSDFILKKWLTSCQFDSIIYTY